MKFETKRDGLCLNGKIPNALPRFAIIVRLALIELP